MDGCVAKMTRYNETNINRNQKLKSMLTSPLFFARNGWIVDVPHMLFCLDKQNPQNLSNSVVTLRIQNSAVLC